MLSFHLKNDVFQSKSEPSVSTKGEGMEAASSPHTTAKTDSSFFRSTQNDNDTTKNDKICDLLVSDSIRESENPAIQHLSEPMQVRPSGQHCSCRPNINSASTIQSAPPQQTAIAGGLQNLSQPQNAGNGAPQQTAVNHSVGVQHIFVGVPPDREHGQRFVIEGPGFYDDNSGGVRYADDIRSPDSCCCCCCIIT